MLSCTYCSFISVIFLAKSCRNRFLGRNTINSRHTRLSPRESELDRAAQRLFLGAPDGRLPLHHDLASQFFGGTEAKFGGANSSSIELGVKTRKVVFWSILEHMGREEQGRTWCMDAAQLDAKEEEAILKTSSTIYSSQLDRPSFNSIELESSQTRKMLLPP
ncbi:unnamed protein product [Microthlaspi erraticum]|uniref:Uncharacterized protein n=1 Tax=Microthlaspi erraticum TaxID=1685480 RepID=A0A6D2IDR6_9BRAS|nr:unnamed protein product [Microthlaspi erraticum]